MKFLLLASLLPCLAHAAVEADLVDKVPGFDATPFKVYSGYLHVPGPFKLNEYDSLSIHYELHESQGSPSKDPVATWHQGGPGGSSLYGAYGEMGYFQVSTNGTFTNDHAWNKVANMLYLESPAGSSDPIGFSTCSKGGRTASVCSWDDKSQAEAYAHTLQAFFKAYPEFQSNELYLTGESYAGQYLPNIAHYIVNNPQPYNLTGIAVGNGCWGGTATDVQCNGPNSESNNVEMYFGKGLVSKPLYDQIHQVCKFPGRDLGPRCDALLTKMQRQVGPHNVYDIYDNCPNTREWLKRSGKTMTWLRRYLQRALDHNGEGEFHGYQQKLRELGGGYDWSCGAMGAMESFFRRSDVQTAMHLNKPGLSRFDYRSSGPASITLYPELVKNMRVLIYNGDSDACVPYKGNEEWTESMATNKYVTEAKSWHPWYVNEQASAPAGYATTYTVNDPVREDASFAFITIRLAGHMVPNFQPAAAETFFTNFLARKPF